jgi:dTDP-4-amino-4,6-dideoxygalactose transaminase
VPTAQYYPKHLARQTAYRDFPVGAGGLAVSDDISTRILALPMHPYLKAETQELIAAAVSGFYRAGA